MTQSFWDESEDDGEFTDRAQIARAPYQLLLFGGDDFRIQRANAEAVRALGYSLDALKSLSFFDIAPELSKQTWHRLTRGMDSGMSAAMWFETRFRRQDGSTYLGQVKLDRVDDGDRVGFYAIVKDRTGSADADAGSRLDGALLRSIVETSPDAIVTIDELGGIRSFSNAAERMFGYRAAEVLGLNVSILMAEPYRSEHDSYLERMRAEARRTIGLCQGGGKRAR